ncbi:centrosomal protein of 55 kDa-like [Seriola dumerili]|uniref:centrosomal protein of 55 kDa-like n=1 Tax=Seriola dumerili TaxID=41447 RepID=UPI000BBE8FCD|nr:centrosomal protein of 55 kDa-like [Seriola dumerili]
MASSKNKSFLKKKRYSEPDVVVSSLRKENAYLKKTLVDLSRQHSEHYKLLEKFLSLETVRLEKDEKTALPSEQFSKKGGDLAGVASMRTISATAREVEEIKNKIVSVSTRCQSLENKVTGKKASKTDEQASIASITELQNHLRDALEKNKQWLEYDQQREAYVRAIIARMLWLEKQLNEANQARSKQHNEEHSDEKELIRQMQEHYERLLQKAKDELVVLREKASSTHQNVITLQNWHRERETEMEELKQQLHSAKMSSKNEPEDLHWSEDEAQRLRDERKHLQGRLDAEKRRSANFELQANLFQKYMLNRHHADQEKMADLERQINISSQDLKDERQDCSYLKKQMVRVLKTLKKAEGHVTKQSKSPISSTQGSLLNESYLECPGCRAEYPASHYRELINHLEICLD